MKKIEDATIIQVQLPKELEGDSRTLLKGEFDTFFKKVKEIDERVRLEVF